MSQPQSVCPTTTRVHTEVHMESRSMHRQTSPQQRGGYSGHKRLKQKKKEQQKSTEGLSSTTSYASPSSDQARPEENRPLWIVLHMCATSLQLGQASVWACKETALHGSDWATHSLHRPLGLGHKGERLCPRRVHTLWRMLSVQTTATTNQLL